MLKTIKKNNKSNNEINYVKVIFKILDRLNELQQHHKQLAGKAIENCQLNKADMHDEIYHEYTALEEYITEDLLN